MGRAEHAIQHAHESLMLPKRRTCPHAIEVSAGSLGQSGSGPGGDAMLSNLRSKLAAVALGLLTMLPFDTTSDMQNLTTSVTGLLLGILPLVVTLLVIGFIFGFISKSFNQFQKE